MAAKVDSCLLASGAVSEGDVPVGNVVEELNLALVEHQAGSNGVHGSISPSLVEETTILVERLKKVNVLLASQPLQAPNLKVGPLSSLVSYTLG